MVLVAVSPHGATASVVCSSPHLSSQLTPFIQSTQHLLCRQKEIWGKGLVLKWGYTKTAAEGKQCDGVCIVRAAKRIETGRSLVLSSTLVVEEGNEEKVKELCHGIRKWALEKMKDPQAGLKQFECYVDTFDNNVFHFWEQYISFLAMNNFRALPEHIKFLNDVRPYLKSPVALAAYEYRDGQIGHMLNPIGPKGEGGLDDATGQGGGGGGASYTQQSGAIIHGLEAEPEREKWGLESMLAKIRSPEKEKSEGWSLKTLFGSKK